jgi:hypothetical protein
MLIEITAKKTEPQIDPAIENSKRVIASLRKLVREHNAENDKKVTFNQLKAVFIEGTASSGGDSTLHRGYARINMFCRLLKAGSFVDEFKNNAKVTKSNLIDFSNYISPSEQDYSRAKEDMKVYKIDFTIASIDELYFTDYEHFPLEAYL